LTHDFLASARPAVPRHGRAQTSIDPDKGIQAVTAPSEPGPGTADPASRCRSAGWFVRRRPRSAWQTCCPGPLVTVTCSLRQELLRLAGVRAVANAVICHSFAEG